MGEQNFEEWAILELFGHKRIAGRVTEQEIAGAGFLRLDVPMRDGTVTTHFFQPSSVYAMHPVTEEVARAVALANEPEPVHRWELPAPAPVEDLKQPATLDSHRVFCPVCSHLLRDDGICPSCGWELCPVIGEEEDDDYDE